MQTRLALRTAQNSLTLELPCWVSVLTPECHSAPYFWTASQLRRAHGGTNTHLFATRRNDTDQRLNPVAAKRHTNERRDPLPTTCVPAKDFDQLLASYGGRPWKNTELPALGAWIASLDSTTWLQKVAADARLPIVPEHVFKKPVDSPEVVQACLEAYIAKLHGMGNTKQQLESIYGEQKLGHHAMLWFCKQYGAFDAGTYPLLVRAIVHCVVAEQGDAHLRHWRSLASPAGGARSSIEEKYDWKRYVLLYFAESKAFWSQDGLNASIREFIHATDHDKKHFPRVQTFRSSGGTWILKQLLYRRSSAGSIDPGLHEHFTDLLRTWKHDQGDHDFNVARLKCLHPQDPQGSSALEFLKKWESAKNQPIFIQDLFQPKDGRGASTLYGFLLQAARILYCQGHEDESGWILDLGKRLVPGFFGEKHRAKSTRAPSAMRWRGAGSDVVTFGDDGYRIRTKREDLIRWQR